MVGTQQRQLSVGSLVWAHVASYPWWPGQVMDVARAHPAQLKARRPGVLVAFFGDNSWGWFTPELLVDFVTHAGEKAKQRTSLKNFKLAVEEAQEVVDRRAQRTPATQHEPWDSLDAEDPRNQPDGGAGDDEEEQRRQLRDLRPPPVDAAAAVVCTAAEALAWLRRGAAWMPQEPDAWLSAVKADAARRLIFSLAASQATRRPKAKIAARIAGTARQAAVADAVSPTPEKQVTKGGPREKKRKLSKVKARALSRASEVKVEISDAPGSVSPVAETAGEGTQAAGPKGVRAYRRRLDVDLGQVVPLLRVIAARPGWFMDGSMAPGPAGAAALRFREKVYLESSMSLKHEMGRAVKEAVRACQLDGRCTQPTKAARGVSAERGRKRGGGGGRGRGRGKAVATPRADLSMQELLMAELSEDSSESDSGDEDVPLARVRSKAEQAAEAADYHSGEEGVDGSQLPGREARARRAAIEARKAEERKKRSADPLLRAADAKRKKVAAADYEALATAKPSAQSAMPSKVAAQRKPTAERVQQGQPARSTITLHFQPDCIMPSREQVWFQAKRIATDLGIDSVRTAGQQKKMHINYRTATEALKAQTYFESQAHVVFRTGDAGSVRVHRIEPIPDNPRRQMGSQASAPREAAARMGGYQGNTYPSLGGYPAASGGQRRDTGAPPYRPVSAGGATAPLPPPPPPAAGYGAGQQPPPMHRVAPGAQPQPSLYRPAFAMPGVEVLPVDPRRGGVTRIMRTVPPPAPPNAPPPQHYAPGPPLYQQQHLQMPGFGYHAPAPPTWPPPPLQQQQHVVARPIRTIPNPPLMPLSFGMTSGVGGHSAGPSAVGAADSYGSGATASGRDALPSGYRDARPHSAGPTAPSPPPASTAVSVNLEAILRSAGVALPGLVFSEGGQNVPYTLEPVPPPITVSAADAAAADNVDISNDLYALLGQLASGNN